jgi:agmatinase
MSDLKVAANELQSGTVALLGVPFDGGATFRPGQALAPARIRESFYSDSTNLCAENGIDLATVPGWRDVGDLRMSAREGKIAQIEKAIRQLLDRGTRVMTLGGDHSITYPILRAYADKYSPLCLLQLDAHSDLYDEFGGNRYSHASPFARIMEEQLVERLAQVGIRTLTPHQREQAKKFGVEVFEMREWESGREIEVGKNVYLSVDLDVLDPAYAPGVSHHEPGGLTTREILGIIQGLRGSVVGADVVEYNPERDLGGTTAMVAAKLVKELVVRMME